MRPPWRRSVQSEDAREPQQRSSLLRIISRSSRSQSPSSSEANRNSSRFKSATTREGSSDQESSTPVEQQPFASCGVILGRDWALDIVGLPHNAVRRELRGLNCIIIRLPSGQCEENSEAKAWFVWVVELIEYVFALQEQHIFARLAEVNATLPESLSTTRRAVRHGRARSMCAAVNEALTTGDGIRSAVNRLENVVLSYFAAIESTIPQLLRSKLEESAKSDIVRAYSVPLARTNAELFMLVARGFNDDDLQCRFIAAYGPARQEYAAFRSRIDKFEVSRIDGVCNFGRKART